MFIAAQERINAATGVSDPWALVCIPDTKYDGYVSKSSRPATWFCPRLASTLCCHGGYACTAATLVERQDAAIRGGILAKWQTDVAMAIQPAIDARIEAILAMFRGSARWHSMKVLTCGLRADPVLRGEWGCREEKLGFFEETRLRSNLSIFNETNAPSPDSLKLFQISIGFAC